MEIVENQSDYWGEFVALNEQWIQEHFELEDFDHDLASNPGQITEQGGYIFSLVKDGSVLATCALFYIDDKTYELARMAVSKAHRGNGYANLLLDKCLQKSKDLHAEKLCLVSNTRLKQAIGLYTKYGFVTTKLGQHPVYKRANIEMELEL